jgi:GT2 family glycosyltransferase
MSGDTAGGQAGTVGGEAGDAIAVELRSPIRVAIIDVAEPLRDLDCTRQEEPPYTGAWILVCDSGYPLGSIEIPLAGTLITAAELKHELQRHFSGTRSPVDRDAEFALPRISVVIPSNLARVDQLRRCVARMTELDYPDYEVIVVDNRRGKVPPVDVPGARVVREPQPGISAARNRGIAVATGEIVIFTDDDVVPSRQWLRAIAERFAHEPDAAAVTGLMVPLELETDAQILFEQSGSGPDRAYKPLSFRRSSHFRVVRRSIEDGTEQAGSLYKTGEFGLGSNMAFRTSVLRGMGGFDVALGVGTPAPAGDDLALFIELLSAGHRIAYEPSAITQHCHRATVPELEQQIHAYGIGFTAMLTAIIVRNPRHLLGLASVLPEWLGSMRNHSTAKQLHRPVEYPPSLARAELWGMLLGPLAYLRSRWVHRAGRRWPS